MPEKKIAKVKKMDTRISSFFKRNIKLSDLSISFKKWRNLDQNKRDTKYPYELPSKCRDSMSFKKANIPLSFSV
jgi:hypothetical protein